MMEKTAHFESVFQHLYQPGVMGVLIATREGFLLDSSLPLEDNLDDVASLVSSIAAFATRTVGHLYLGHFASAMIEGENALFTIVGAGEETMLGIVSARSINRDRLMMRAREGAEMTARIVEYIWHELPPMGGEPCSSSVRLSHIIQ